MGGPNFTFISYVSDHAVRITLLLAITLGLAVAASATEGRFADAQVGNAPPTADTGGPYLIEEGSTGALDATGSSDSDGTIALYEWDLDDDGVYGETGPDAANGDETGSEPVFSAALLDGPLAHPISLRVTDDLGDTDTADSTVNVTNVTVADAGGPYTVAEGGSVTLAATSDDPAPADTVEFAWDFDDDGIYDDATGADAEFTAAGLDGPGSVTISVQVTDDDGGTATSDAIVNIENAAPAVTVIGDVIVAGETATVSVGFTDPSPTDTHTAVIDWGDGSAPDDLGAVTSPVDVMHIYADPGEYTVSATVTDSDGAEGMGEATVQAASPTPDFFQVVNSTGDGEDLTLLDGICWTGGVNSEGEPECTLRAAIEQSNFTSGFNAIQFDIPGSDAGFDGDAWTIEPAATLPAVIDTVSIDGYTQPGAAPNTGGPGSGLDTALKIEIDGSASGIETGLTLVAADNDVTGIAIGGFTGAQISIASTSGSNIIAGNFIGADASGAAAFGGGDGLYIQSSGNVIGGVAPGDRNLVSGNVGAGIVIAGSEETAATGNVASGNIIGLSADGVSPLGNTGAGVWLVTQANENLIGGASPEEGNVISGNGGAGVSIALESSENQVSANLIGTDVTGMAAVGNATGVSLSRADDNLIGGTAPEMSNLISGNNGPGIHLMTEFVLPESGRPENTIIQGNMIGVDITGEGPLGNTGHGVLVGNAPGTLIGGSGLEESNIIAFNGGDGVRVEYPLAGIAIIGNSIHSNGGLGIDLEGDGVSPNDDGDSDTGANNLQNFPVIESAVVTDDTITVSGYLGTAFANGYLIELFVNEVCDPESGHGEGQLLLGSTLVNLNGTGMALFSETYEISLPKGIFITATATHPDGSTSEFSECAVTTGAPPVADAGGPYTVNEGGSTTLDGSGSTDPDGEITLFAWDFDGDGVTDAVGETPLFDATSLDGPDSITVTLTVTDDEGLQSASAAEVTVQNVNPSVNVTGDSIDEGQSATVEITFADSGVDDTHEVIINWGDGSAPENAGIVESPLSRSHLYEEDGAFTVTVTVTDDDGGVGEGTATVDVAPVNDPPVADAGGPYEVDEGFSMTLDGTASVDPDGTIVLYEWDFDGDSVTDATGDSALFDAALIDGPESFTITLTVTDDGGLTDAVTTTVSVLNVAPSVDASGDMVTLGETATVDVEFTDPAAADSHTATIDWGDGAAVEDLGAVTSPFAPTHDYASADVYEVTVTITDDDGGVTIDTAFVTVMEEEELEPHEIWTQIDSGDDDAFHTPSGWPHYSDTEVVVHAGAPGSSGPTYGGFRWDNLDIPEGAVILEVYVELKQKDWGYKVETTLALQDSPDGDSFSQSDSPYTRWAGSRSDFEMPWTADLKVPGTWISTPDLSEGVQELVNRYGGINSLVLLESGEGAANGKYHNWRAFDLNHRTAAKLHIRYMAPNVAPVVDAGPDREITEGDMLQLNGASFVDGSEGAFTATIDWGDGTVEAGNVNPATHAVTGMHSYADDGVYTVTVSVTDASGKTGADTLTVTVNNAAPTVDAGPPQTSDTDTPVSLLPSWFTDPGLLDTHTATIDWGDDTVEAGAVGQGSGSGSVAGSHTYGIGAYTVEVCVTDDDGGVGCDTFTVVVEPPPGDIQEAWAMLLSGSDDAYHSPGGWPHYSDSDTVVYAGSPDGTGATYGGWRWSGLDIPEGAIILDAHVELTQSQWGYPVTTTLSLQDADSPGTFTADSTPFDRWDGRTDFETSWSWPKGAANSRISTPDLAAGLQELIDRYGTVDALVLLESGEGTVNGEYHEWRSIESGPQYAPKLYIRYVAPNEEPVVEAGDAVAVTEGDTVDLGPASFDDTTAGDHTAVIDWGDGTVEAGTVDQAAHTVFGSHAYGDNGVYTVTVTVTDVGELSGSDSFTVTVSNAAPVVNAGDNITVDEGESVSLEPARFTDAGLLDTHTATIDWGDGTVAAGVLGQAPGEGTVAGTHTYAGGGVFTVQVCVTDDDLATGCDMLTATVNGAPEPEPGEVLAQIASGSDDAYHSPGGWPHFSDNDTVVFAGAPNGSGPTYGGWRWIGLDIPAGAIITGAYVELKQSQWGHEVTTTLSMQDAASPATFTSGSTPFDRWSERSDFEMAWDWPKATPDTWISTPDLAAGVQELVDSHGGIDSLALLESGEGVSDTEYHEWRSFESGAENAAKLHITWRFPEPLTPEWSGVGQVLFVGPSPDPSALTLTSAEFDLNEDGSINQVVVNTENEFVAGALFGGIGGGALTGCRDAEGGASCATLNSLLTGATVSSLHTSTATLTVFAESVIQVPLETPGGIVVLDVPIVSGSLVGQLEGLFIIDQGPDRAIGTASMQINPGSSGTYACFELTPLGPVPLTSLDACVNGTGGQFYPIILDVFDTGTFAVGQGTGELSEIVSLSGSVEVAAQSNLLLQEFGGTITIPSAVAQVSGGSITTLGASAAALPNTQSLTVIAARRRREEEEGEALA